MQVQPDSVQSVSRTRATALAARSDRALPATSCMDAGIIDDRAQDARRRHRRGVRPARRRGAGPHAPRRARELRASRRRGRVAGARRDERGAHARWLAVALLAGCTARRSAEPPQRSATRSPRRSTAAAKRPDRARARACTPSSPRAITSCGNMAVALDEVKRGAQGRSELRPGVQRRGADLRGAARKTASRRRTSSARCASIRSIPTRTTTTAASCASASAKHEAMKYFLRRAAQSALPDARARLRERRAVLAPARRHRGGRRLFPAGAQGAARRSRRRCTSSRTSRTRAGDYEQAKQYLVRLEQVATPTPEVLWLALRVERRLGDRNAEASLRQQLRRISRFEGGAGAARRRGRMSQGYYARSDASVRGRCARRGARGDEPERRATSRGI